MGDDTDELPKSFLDVGGKTIIERQLDALPDECASVTLVLGYGFEERDPETVLSRYAVPDRIDLETVVFDDWDRYDNAASCLCALDGIDDDVLVLCGDVIFDRSVAETLVERFDAELKPAGFNAAGAYEGVQDEMTAVRWDANGVITDYGAISGHREAGMFVFNRAHLDDVRAILQEHRSEWFPVVLPRVPTKRVLLDAERHHEINTPEHLREAIEALPFGPTPSIPN